MKPKTKVLVIERLANYYDFREADTKGRGGFLLSLTTHEAEVLGIPECEPGKSLKVEITVKQLEQKS